MRDTLILPSLGAAFLIAALATGCTKGDSTRAEPVTPTGETSTATQPEAVVALYEVTLEVLGMT